jgi:hypothetical protein
MIYQPGKYLRLYYEGMGNVEYFAPPPNANAVDGANDGLSETANIAKLGQSVGAVGDPAQLTESREIPFEGNALFFGKDDGVSDIIGFDPTDGISISNAAGPAFRLFGFGINTNFVQLSAILAAIQVADSALNFNTPTGGVEPNISLLNFFYAFAWRHSTTSVEAFTWLDDVLILDTASNNITCTIQAPASMPGKKGVVKKKGTDANSITLNVATVGALIYGSSGGAATFVYSGPGESIEWFCDGQDIYII